MINEFIFYTLRAIYLFKDIACVNIFTMSDTPITDAFAQMVVVDMPAGVVPAQTPATPQVLYTDIAEVLVQIRPLVADGINATNMLKVIVAVMKIVDERPISGAAKKEFVIVACGNLADKYITDPVFAELFKKVLPTTIDDAYSLANDAYVFGRSAVAKCRAKCAIL